MQNPARYFNRSPEIIRLTVVMYGRYPLSLRQVENLLFETPSLPLLMRKTQLTWKLPSTGRNS